MESRFFCAATDSVYESVRATLDAQWGLPAAGQMTCFDPVRAAVRDALGRPLIAVNAAFCEYDAVKSILPQLLTSGSVVEISETAYLASVPRPSMPIA